MNKFSFGMFNIISIAIIAIFILIAACPFNLTDMEQAKRIANWKNQYEKLNYCFSLVDMHEGSLAEKIDMSKENANEFIISKIKPYFNFLEDKPIEIKKYKYKRKNGRTMPKNSIFHFDKFIKCKDGALISFKKNIHFALSEKQPLYYMFIDINGEEKPNRIGQDIFFINIFTHHIKALGYDKEYSRLKQNCSTIGSGLYCSEFYLLGGRF